MTVNQSAPERFRLKSEVPIADVYGLESCKDPGRRWASNMDSDVEKILPVTSICYGTSTWWAVGCLSANGK